MVVVFFNQCLQLLFDVLLFVVVVQLKPRDHSLPGTLFCFVLVDVLFCDCAPAMPRIKRKKEIAGAAKPLQGGPVTFEDGSGPLPVLKFSLGPGLQL